MRRKRRSQGSRSPSLLVLSNGDDLDGDELSHAVPHPLADVFYDLQATMQCLATQQKAHGTLCFQYQNVQVQSATLKCHTPCSGCTKRNNSLFSV